MKTLHLSIMIVGIIISIIGYGQYANIMCNCPPQIAGQPSTCHCGEIQKAVGDALIYAGIVVSLSGVTLVTVPLIRKSSTEKQNE